MSFRYIAYIALTFFFITSFILTTGAASLAFASLPPTTTATLSGTTGQNNWYTSAVNVKLSATDDLEGVASTTYWLNNNPPTTQDFTLGENAILNPSFEKCAFRFFGFCVGIKNWSKYAERWGVLMWRSSEAYAGSFSAAIGNFWGGEAFWYNRGSAVPVTPETTYNLSVWIKVYSFDPSTEVNAQVWSKGAHFSDDQLIAQTDLLTQTSTWTNFALSFATPTNASSIYLRLRAKATSPLTVALFDEALLAMAEQPLVEFNILENGRHTLHFFSTDRAENAETEKTRDLQIDTLAPSDWQNFAFETGDSSHKFSGSIEVKDVTAGVDVSSAKYRFYSDHQNWGWSDWLPAESVKLAGTGLPASNGETAPVVITTPQTDFGDSATVYQFQFQIADMAGSLSNSPIQTIEGPWVQSLNGATATSAQINFKVGPPPDKFNANDLLISSQTITNFTTSTLFQATNYNDEHLYTAKTLASAFPNYQNLAENADPLPQNKLPGASGVYKYSGDFVIDGKTLNPSFEKSILSAIILISGNLRVKKSFELNPASGVVFLVNGAVEVEGEVEKMAGVFVSEGSFNSNIDAKSNKQLKVTGAVLSLDKFVLSRDLGKGAQGNSVNPAEQFVLPPALFENTELANLIEGREQKITWLEVGK